MIRAGNPTTIARANQITAATATVLLIGALGYAVALLAIGIMPQPESVSRLEPIMSTPTGTARSGNASSRAATAHLFGEARSEPKIAEVEQVKEAPVSRLSLRLLGVLATDNEQPGYAIISGGGSGEQVVGIGDSVDDVVLREIHASHVIIENRGALERLELPKIELDNVSVAASTNVNQATNSPAVNTDATGGGGLVDVASLPQTPGELRDYLVRNPATIQQLVSIGAHRENGKVVGYRLMPKQDTAILRNYGIEPGDVVTSLNGVRLDNQRRGLKALRQLVTASNIDMTVMRNGAEIPINIALQ